MKIKQLLPIAAIALLFTATSCQKQPQADFKLSKTEVNSGEKVTCTNSSTEADHYVWTFPDGNTLKTKDAYVIWKTPETVNVKLQAFSKNGKKTDEITKSFTVRTYNYLFEGSFTGSSTSSGCGLDKSTNTISGSDKIKMDLGGGLVFTVKIINATNGIIEDYYESDSYGYSIYGGTITIRDNELTINLKIQEIYQTDPSMNSTSYCTSVLTK